MICSQTCVCTTYAAKGPADLPVTRSALQLSPALPVSDQETDAVQQIHLEAIIRAARVVNGSTGMGVSCARSSTRSQTAAVSGRVDAYLSVAAADV